jgi:hypothetical protein
LAAARPEASTASASRAALRRCSADALDLLFGTGDERVEIEGRESPVVGQGP